jgi:hypothetical protein
MSVRELRFERWQLLKGPAFLDGKIVRAVEAWDQYGGHLQAPEVWCGHNWINCMFAREGPLLSEVMQAPLATKEQLDECGVVLEPLPGDYHPISDCPHCA